MSFGSTGFLQPIRGLIFIKAFCCMSVQCCSNFVLSEEAERHQLIEEIFVWFDIILCFIEQRAQYFFKNLLDHVWNLVYSQFIYSNFYFSGHHVNLFGMMASTWQISCSTCCLFFAVCFQSPLLGQRPFTSLFPNRLVIHLRSRLSWPSVETGDGTTHCCSCIYQGQNDFEVPRSVNFHVVFRQLISSRQLLMMHPNRHSSTVNEEYETTAS